MNRFWAGTALLVLVVATGCQTTKKTMASKPLQPAKVAKVKPSKKRIKKAPKTTDTVVINPSAVQALGPLDPEYARLNQQLDLISGKNVSFQTFSGKAKAKLTRGDESNEFTANIRIRKDAAIWINISALGGMVNVARVYVTPDSVRMINFLQKTATLLPVVEVGKLLPVTVSFNDLQALLLGRIPPLPSPSENAITSIRIEGNTVRRTVGGTSTSQWTTFDPTDTTAYSYEIVQGSSQQPLTLTMQLRTPVPEDAHRFFKERTTRWTTPASTGELQLEFDTPQWDGELSTPFSVPKNYQLN